MKARDSGLTDADVLAAARTWIGTPYRHQASQKGVGCDCLGLLRGIWREFHGGEPEMAGPYAPDWAGFGNGDRLTAAAERHLLPSPEMMPGSVILFRWRDGMPASHAGIYAGDGRFIHAYQGHGVVSSALVPHWRRRISGIFRFPDGRQ